MDGWQKMHGNGYVHMNDTMHSCIIFFKETNEGIAFKMILYYMKR